MLYTGPALVGFQEPRDVIVTYQKRCTAPYRNEVLGIGKPSKPYRH